MRMARRNDRESSGFGSKLTVWVITILIATWAGHDPHQVLAVVHAIAAAVRGDDPRRDVARAEVREPRLAGRRSRGLTADDAGGRARKRSCPAVVLSTSAGCPV